MIYVNNESNRSKIELPVIEGGIEIGRININTGEVMPHEDNLVSWECCMDGECCHRFNIPVTDFDIKRIEKHGYEMDQIVEDTNPMVRMPKNQFGSVEKNYPIKKKPYEGSCTFLTNEGKCGIHEFRPFGCRIFPFQFIFDDEKIVRVTIHESNFCHNVEGVKQENAQNVEFLQYLRDELQHELQRRDEYFEEHGDQI